MKQHVVVGIDGGGSSTRAACADLEGNLLAYATSGGTNPSHNANAKQHVQEAIWAVLNAAGYEPSAVAMLVAGMAGLNEPADQEWAAEFTAIAGLHADRLHLNDADIAHAGALAGKPGIIAIAGTGSTIVAFTEQGQRIESGTFHHYAGAARHLAFTTIQHLLTEQLETADAEFIKATLYHFSVANLKELHTLLIAHASQDYREIKRLFGSLASIITNAADTGSPLAGRMCDQAAQALTLGIRLLGGAFTQPAIPVTLIGGLACSNAISRRVELLLGNAPEHKYHLAEPLLPPIGGAILLALTHAGIAINAEHTKRIGDSLERFLAD